MIVSYEIWNKLVLCVKRWEENLLLALITSTKNVQTASGQESSFIAWTQSTEKANYTLWWSLAVLLLIGCIKASDVWSLKRFSLYKLYTCIPVLIHTKASINIEMKSKMMTTQYPADKKRKQIIISYCSYTIINPFQSPVQGLLT
jgi:hypothetical protein